ncbi:MAG: DUF1844 domain-containing protein [Phycisphaeraceae bacterium]|nr:DUF1844 domain-containing protein [Phycisphaeraceae bacterium]
MDENQPSKIIVDSDWKREAEAEKARLEEQAKARAPKAKPGEIDPNAPIGFEDLIRMLASQALMYLGAIPDESGRAMLAPDIARLHIELLGVVEEKTKGNLDEDEDKLLRDVLQELRLQYVEVSKAVAKAVKEGKIKPAGSPPGPSGPGIVP